MIEKVHWMGHASFRLAGKPLVYIDPWKVASRAESADLILVTHSHYDHLSREDIERIQTPSTVTIIPSSCKSRFPEKAICMKPGDSIEVCGIEVEAVPAYNVDKGFHPKENGWLGYVLRLPGGSIYHAGDTDLIDEMNDIDVDLALLPVGGTYTMNAEEAAEAARRVKASVVVPMHWGDIVGKRADAERFARLVEQDGTRVVILEPER